MSPKEISDQELERIASSRSYLLNHLQESFTIRKLARKSALGEERYREGFYKLYEHTVGSYIHQARMGTGRFLIRNTGKSLKEIARLCGYKDYKSFLKAYKKFFSVSAGTDRKHK